MKEKLKEFVNDNRGDFSVKGLAITVGAIVVISAVVLWISGSGNLANSPLSEWIEDVWAQVWAWIQDTFMS